MKIICDNCRTKYSIADEKVRGKVFKIRCKKCQNVIVVKGEVAPAPLDDEHDQATMVASGGAMPVWHLVLDGQQAGPFTEAEVGDKFVRGDIDGSTYTWRDGLPDWAHLAEVEEFAHLRTAEVARAPAAEPVEHRQPDQTADDAQTAVISGVPPAAAAPAPSAASDDLFSDAGGGEPAPMAAAAAAPQEGGMSDDLFSSRSGEDDVFSSSTVGRSGGGQLTAAPAVEGPAPSLTATRNENSVLFSLTNLQALAGGEQPMSASGNSGEARKESSGLIDIKSMASGLPDAAVGSDSPLDDVLGSAMPTAFGAGPGVLLPTEQPSRTGTYIAIAAGVAAILGMGGIVTYLLLQDKEVETVVIEKDRDDEERDRSDEEGDEEGDDDDDDKETDEGDDDDDGEPSGEETDDGDSTSASSGTKKPSGKKPTGRKPTGKKPPSGASTSKRPTPSSPGVSTSKKPKTHGDELDDLLGGALTGKKTKPRPTGTTPTGSKPTPKPAAGKRLSPSDVKRSIASAKGRISKCSALGTGTITVVFSITADGRVSSVKPKPPHTGQPVGKCVAGIVKSLKFPANDGKTPPVTYPIILK